MIKNGYLTLFSSTIIIIIDELIDVNVNIKCKHSELNVNYTYLRAAANP